MTAGAIIIIAITASGVLMMRFRKRWLAKINIIFTNRITTLFAGWLPGFGILTHVGRKSGKVYRIPNGIPIEGGDPPCQPVDKAVQFHVRKRTVDVSVSLRGIAVKIVRAENDFERAAAADQMWEAFRTASPGMHSHPDFALTQSGVLARREAHFAGEDELAA